MDSPLEVAPKSEITHFDQDRYTVPSSSGNDPWICDVVTGECECAIVYHRKPGTRCRHVDAARRFVEEQKQETSINLKGR